jgi:hypothetical protein
MATAPRPLRRKVKTPWFRGHKKVKGDNVVAFCDRNCNVIGPFVSAPGQSQ